MPRIRTSSSTPELRRRELLLLKSSSIDGRVKLALEDAKRVVRLSFEDEQRRRSSHVDEPIAAPQSDSARSSYDENEDQANEETRKFLSSSSSIYHVELASDDEECQPHFITCMNIEPNRTLTFPYRHLHAGRRRRTSSLPSSTLIVTLTKPIADQYHQTSSVTNLPSWQNNPQKVIHLFGREYHCQPIGKLKQNQFLLAKSTQIDVYNIATGLCHEKICFQSPHVNYLAVCYDKFKNDLLVASTTDFFIYNLHERRIKYELRLPGAPFNLDFNKQIRYLSCNSSSIYHGYFSFTSTCTSTVLSRLSRVGLKHSCDLEFDDATMHGLHAFENSVGIIIRYGRYSSKSPEEYCLYVYDIFLDKQLHRVNLNDTGCITCLTGYERTSDWILCDAKKQRLVFVNQESIEYVQFDEDVQQCALFDESKYLAVWLKNRILLYTIE